MRIFLRFTPVLALAAALALGGTSTARAQDTSQVRADTSGYQGYDSAAAAQPTGGSDSGAAGYTGPPTDTALKAKPGVQTGPTAGDSGKAGEPSATAADTVACNDGSNSPRTDGCLKNGGIDWAATEAALELRRVGGALRVTVRHRQLATQLELPLDQRQLQLFPSGDAQQKME